MTKLRTPMLGFGVKGTLADSLTFQERGRISYVRKKPIPTDTKTVAQLAQRQRYRDAVDVWNALTPEEKEAWRGVCPGLTAYQCFMSSELKYAPPPPPEEYTEEQTASNYDVPLQGATFTRIGQRLTIANRRVTKIAFPLKKTANPTGDVTFTIRKVSDDSLIVSKVWGDASALPTSITWLEVELDTPTLVNEQVRLMIEFYGGDASNTVGGRFQASDVKAGEYRTSRYTGAYQDRTDHDGTYRYKYYLV